ncbi:hypothetical protein B7759_03462 [Burkholderia glumae]|nr:hypothetical protein B7759_03462 [Burkholderia glumae]
MRVGDELGRVVRAPQPEVDEPGVQQSRVIRVLDVLHHQLPVARHSLARVAEHGQLRPVEQAVVIAQDVGAEEILEGLDVLVERREHRTATRRHPQPAQRVMPGIEIRRHAAVDLAALPYPTAKRHADQIALQVVVPLVIRAVEVLRFARALAAELHAAMRAGVLEHDHLAVLGARHHDRPLADLGALEIAGRRHLRLQADVAPVFRIEQALQFALVKRIARIGLERCPARAVPLPVERVCDIDG